jgi:NAD(P)-dependent dehydrogenase (short-subunit alcohol dehydrogenase family)
MALGLKGKTALLLGAGGGLGSAIAITLAREARARRARRHRRDCARPNPARQRARIAFRRESRTSQWRPLKAPWWNRKEACIIGADLNGNFPLRHCYESVRYWYHKGQADTEALLATEAPVDAVIARVVAELMFRGGRPGDELEADAVVQNPCQSFCDRGLNTSSL